MPQTISILRIVEDTIVDGPGLRTSIYAAGCPHHCQGCHNPESWNIGNGTETDIDDILDTIRDADFSNVTFTGGDPFFQAESFSELAKKIKEETGKTIWCYTGYTFEEIIGNSKLFRLLKYIDVLVDGPFELSLRDTSLRFRGSSNQRIIDVTRSLQSNSIVQLV
ncbi:MAG: anaerobic ribonucleoside-triphosphate reductase activating protein [Bacteroidales bacterium]|nr:anaerobic ribonucleoside-triphosphate reductase activating protein [Bacteroidales bacterium]MDD4670976.1 anaerobic ribonucleoside-triphosphate reductase activating protein [Bacteroidales bacterium]